ncbi:sugar ABC transporter permease [[Mycoplasma] mobile]|uniref:Maltose ABC transporter permease protein n=1 Tax=Mycoplasma mobile (strain ATCC 43663 / 163K / NCTC 11711) TaxID=267748 RepID=Q6KHQ4_MYCM1|nr:sugar ABC transporter permease [[Mycoplasma] mobile]AAT27874.1 maltose ABC transporter permease protein [Mycoplasma mobile 163K]
MLKQANVIKMQNLELNKMFSKLNPFKTSKVKSFRLDLSDNVIKNIKSELTIFKQKEKLNFKMMSEIKKLLNKSDTRNFLTIFTQEIFKNKKTKSNPRIINFLSAIKIASIVSLYPIQFRGLRKSLQLVSKDLENFAIYLANKYSDEFAKELKSLFFDLEKYAKISQTIIDKKIDKIRNLFWNKIQYLSKIISNEVFKITGKNQNDLEQAYLYLAQYQVLFNEISSYIKSEKNDSLAKNLSFDLISKEVASKYEKVGFYSEKIIDNYAEFQTHISETDDKISLSDLAPLKPSGVISLIFNYITIIIWAIIILFPIFQILILSFDGSGVNTLGDNENIGGGFSFIHYEKLFTQTDFGLWLGNSIIVAISTMIITVLFTTFLAYAFSRFRFKGKSSSLIIILVLQLVPSVASLTAFLVLFQLTQLPLLIFLIIIYSGGAITGNTFVIKGYMDSIPRDLDEAAKIDGSSNLKVFRSILVPLAKPIIAIVALWSFIGPFGDIILPILLSDGSLASVKQLTIAAGLRTLVISTSPGAPIFQYEYLAGAIITSIPITLLFVFAQRFIVGGLTSGAVK